ncbi:MULTISPECIES: hypothetical protein [unclassified Nocardioides]|uniref:hypothetical protein n=1 Tax=unclassified Nocardioides TaxID=2615069 RepID=UPI003014F2D1
MRRRVVPLVLLVVSSLLGTFPATAEDAPPTGRVEIWRAGLPAGFGFRSEPCGRKVDPPVPTTHWYDRDGLTYRVSTVTRDELVRSVSSLASLTSYAPTYSTSYVWNVGVRVVVPGAGLIGTGALPGAGLGRWGHLNVVTDPVLRWTDASGAQVARSTVAELVAERPWAAVGPATIGLGVEACDPDVSVAVSIDDLTVTTGGATTVYDFAAPRVPGVRGQVVEVGHGQSYTMRTRLSQDDEALGAPVQLWARPAGARQERLVATVRVAADGFASATVRPDRTTSFRWRYDGGPLDRPVVWSETSLLVLVRTEASMTVKRIRGHRYVAVIRATPARGQRVGVRAESRDQRWRRRVGSARIGSTGVARVRFEAPHLRWRPNARWRITATVDGGNQLVDKYLTSTMTIPSGR